LSFTEEYMFWKVAEYLIDQQGYRILQLSRNQEELWLEKTENKQVQVVRLLHYNIDWSNWLQRDIEMTAENGANIRKQLAKKELKLFNLYFTAYAPVDDYEFRLAKPYFSSDGKAAVTSLLFDREKGPDGLRSLEELFNAQINLEFANDITFQEIEELKKKTLSKAEDRARAEQALFNYGEPFFTYLFIAAQVIVFLIMEALGGSTDTENLIKFGAKFNPLILEGEWWRFFTPIFIHIGLLHLLMNTMALFYLGTLVERVYGNLRFLVIYILAGFGGVLASFLFSPNLSAGASGAIFGCFGALLYFGLINPRLFWRTLGLNILIVLGINLAFGFTVPGIDNAGHLGGLAGGFAAAGILHLPKKKRPFMQLVFLVGTSAIVLMSLQYSFSGKADVVDEQSVIVLAQQHIKAEEYEKADELLSAYTNKGNPSSRTLFLLSFVEIKQNSLQEAKEHLHQVIEMEPGFHEALYNLALIYFEEQNFSEAEKYAKLAVEIEPDQQDYQETLEQIRNYLEEAA
jgi:rhomboid protease GluP